MILSPFTPLFFSHHKRDGIDSKYIQTFATSDEILIELIGGVGDSVVAKVFTEPDHIELYQIQSKSWQINGTCKGLT